MLIISEKDRAKFIEGSELLKLTDLIMTSRHEWRECSLETFLELQRITISYIRCGFKGVDAVIPGSIVPLWNACKMRMDRYLKAIYEWE